MRIPKPYVPVSQPHLLLREDNWMRPVEASLDLMSTIVEASLDLMSTIVDERLRGSEYVCWHLTGTVKNVEVGYPSHNC